MRRVGISLGLLLVFALLAFWFARGETAAPPSTGTATASAPEENGVPEPTNDERERVDTDGPEDEGEFGDLTGWDCTGADSESDDRVWLEPREILVVSAETGEPVEGALVQCRIRFPDYMDDPSAPLRQRAHTGADGIARIPRSTDTLQWWVRADGYLAVQPEMPIRNESSRIELSPAPSLYGVVVDARDGDPVSGAELRAEFIDDPWSQVDTIQTTGADGRFAICGVPESAAIELTARHHGLGIVTVDVAAFGERGQPVRITIGAGGTVTGVVRDAKGRGVPDAEVFVTPADQDTPLRPARWNTEAHAFARSFVTSGAGGEFAVRGIAVPSEVIVYARADGGREGQSGRVALPNAASTATQDVVVQALGALRVAIIDAETKAPVNSDSARLSIDSDWGSARDDQKPDYEVSSEGGPDFPRLGAGKHVLHVGAPRGYLDAGPVPFEAVAGETITVTVPLDAGRTVTGRVLGTDGEPVEVYVSFDAEWKGVMQYPNTRSGPDGHFTLRGVPPVAGELSIYERGSDQTSWPNIEIEGDVGDLIMAPPARVVGRLPVEFAGVRFRTGVLSSRGGHSGGGSVASDGRVDLSGITPGRTATVYVKVEGRAALVLRGITLAQGETRDLGDIVFPESHTLVGRLVDATGAPISGALVRTVEWWTWDDPRTEADGRFRMEHLPPGIVTLAVEAGATTMHFQQVDVTTTTQTVDVQIPAPGRLRLCFTESDGEPWAGQPVNVYRLLDTDEPDWQRRTIPRTDSRGVLDLELSPGHYGLQPHGASGAGPIEPSPTFEIQSGVTLEVEFTLD